MENIEILFFLLLSSILLVGLAQKINVPYPLVLIIGGAFISFIPGIGNIYFDPHLVLTLFLPPILYYSAFGISFRQFQRSWKNILSLALGLVVATTLAVGVIFKWLFPELPWALAFAFGAIISPPDAIAVTSILKRFSINSRLVTLLEGESLVNDASAIVIYKITMVALMTGTLSIGEGISSFLFLAVGGISVGLILGLICQEFSRRYLEPVLGVVFSFAIPYVTYIVADWLSVSGVLAVVVNGLIGARFLRQHHSSLRRVLGYACWDIFTIFLNCFVFILIGLQVRTIAAQMTLNEIITYSGYALLIAVVMVLVRMLWVYGRAIILYINALTKRNASKICPLILKEAALITWCSMRGIVSLAISLALPFTLPDGSPLQGRNEVIFITFEVILLTLLIPGLTLPFLIRGLKLPSFHNDDKEKQIRNELAHFAKEKIAYFRDIKRINDEEYVFLKSYFSSQHKALELAHEHDLSVSDIEHVRREIIRFQRIKLIEIWKRDEIDDEFFNHVESELDILDTHIARAELKKGS